jgi:RND family efflux transporter MFP subunit
MWKLRICELTLCSVSVLALACQGPGGGATHGEEAIAATAPAPPRQVAATGRVEGWREADVTSKLPGRVLSFEYGEGDAVEGGAPVVRLEDLDLQTRVRKVEARAAEAALTLKRTRALRADGIVSASELDRAESAYRTLAAALDEARTVLDYATVKAPFRGTVLRKFKEAGEGVAVNGAPDPLFRIADLSRLKVMAEVPENEIAAVQTGQPAAVSMDAYPGERFAARVSRVGSAVGRKTLRSDDPRKRLDEKVIEVELALAGDARLKSGMSVDVVFEAE